MFLLAEYVCSVYDFGFTVDIPRMAKSTQTWLQCMTMAAAQQHCLAQRKCTNKETPRISYVAT